jgi:hypothetical protein
MLNCMKMHLTNCNFQMNKNFGFGSVLYDLFFERVPGMILRTCMREHQ